MLAFVTKKFLSRLLIPFTNTLIVCSVQDLNLEKKVEMAVDAGKDGAAATSKQVEKTSSTLKHNHGDCTTKMTFANDKMAFEGKGKLVDDDGWKVDITGAGEVKQAKKEWKLTGQLDA